MRRVVADARTLFDGAQMKPVDLTDACLNNVRMVDLKLSSSILLRTSLVGADLQHTEFEASDMRGVRFGDFETNCVCDIPGGPTRCQMTLVRGTNFKDADLSPADGRPSDLSGVDFRGVQFKGADLRQVLVRRTDLRNADLTDADLSGGVDLTTTLLSNTNLRGADMTDADMSNNDIFNGRLKEANLTRTNLRGTRLDGADLSGALLNETQTDQDTNLRGADLSMTAVVGCLRADLTEADFTDSSLLRAGLVAPGNRVFDSDSDFNCRIQFEGALLPADNDVCGSGFPSDWIATGMTRNGVYVMERLIEKLPRTLECAWLADTDLRAANLAGADLRGALLASTRLDRSDTGRFTNLEGADLRKAVLEGADLDWANLRGADLREAELTGTDLKHADLRGADLRNVVLNDSTQFKLAMYECAGGGGGSCTKFPDYPTFRWRQLQMIGPQSDLEGMDLGGYPGLSSPPVDLTGANVKGAKFVWTDVSGVKFKSCNLENANFSNGIARGADFSGANAKKATFSGANVSGAKFSNANIIEANFVGNGGDPDVSGSLCSEDTSFNSAKVAYVFILKISIEGSFPLYFPVITLEFLPGWNVKGKCCFPVKGGLRIGC